VSRAGLAVSDLDAPFGAAPGLRRVAFDVAPGERLVIVGGSGAGKTTLLRAVAGLAPTTAGQISIAGRDVSREPPERRDAVYLHQTPLLFPHLTVAENVAFPLRVRRVPPASIETRVREALGTVQLGDFGNRSPRTLSGGQRHRVALARAVIARPAVLLLDEPLSALDPSLRDEVRESLLVVQHQYLPAIVVVTHDLEEAGTLAHRIGVLLAGQIAQLASPRQLFVAPATLEVARFLGIPNLVRGVMGADGVFDAPIGPVATHDRPAAPGPRVAAFRLDAARLSTAGMLTGRVTGIRQGPRGSAIQLDAGGTAVEVAAGTGKLPEPGSLVTWELDPSRCTFLEP
jgi:putative spermidine/putrescine transport system ATP-binding protein